MTKSRFLDFKIAAVPLNFHGIPFSKVKHLRYEGTECQMLFKTDFMHAFQRVFISQQMRWRKFAILSNAYGLPVPRQLSSKSGMLRDKKKDLLSMLKYRPSMSPCDRAYYTAICSKN